MKPTQLTPISPRTCAGGIPRSKNAPSTAHSNLIAKLILVAILITALTSATARPTESDSLR